MEISSQEWTDLSWRLEQHHALFYQLWQLGKPILCEDYPTTAVRFNEDGDLLEFVFNPSYWSALNGESRAFAIAHECLHLILQHGTRISSIIQKQDPQELQLCNLAIDVVVNHLLINSFGFSRPNIFNSQSLCWIDTVFPENSSISEDQSFEYYYSKIKELFEGEKSIPPGSALDDHSALQSPGAQKILEAAVERLTGGERESLYSSVGSEAACCLAKVDIKPKIKRSWETVAVKPKIRKDSFIDIEQWVKQPRRLSLLNSSLLLPSNSEDSRRFPELIDVWMFLDASGSCWNIKGRLCQAAASLNPRKFKVKLHSFDSQVYELKFGSSEIRGSGGTCFSVIEKFIRDKTIDDDIAYPDAVFVLTDGYGDHLLPKYPERWHWFLTRISSKEFIPKKSHCYYLADFE